MAKRTVVYGSPTSVRAGGTWRNPEGPKTHFQTKEPAIDVAKSIAKAAPLGQVKIQKENGRLQTEHTYGADPRRRKG